MDLALGGGGQNCRLEGPLRGLGGHAPPPVYMLKEALLHLGRTISRTEQCKHSQIL
jgi:hypothetical protein